MGVNNIQTLSNLFVDNKANGSNGNKKKDATDANYSHLGSFLNDFGLNGNADVLSEGMRLKGWLEITSLKDVEEGMTFLKGDELETVVDLLKQNPKNNNVYTATNARMVQLGDIAQTDKIDGTKYIFSEKPLTAKQIDEWELSPLYTTEEFVAKSETQNTY